MISKFIQTLEQTKITTQQWIASLFAIIIIRLVFESFSAKAGDLFTITSFTHAVFFFVSVILSLIVIMQLFSKEKTTNVAKVALIGWLTSLVPPIVDLIAAKGKGNYVISYLFEPPTEFFNAFITFFGPELTQGMTIGVRVQTVLACIFVGIYIYIKTKNTTKTIAAALTTYCAIFFYAILPSLIMALSTLSLSFSKADIISFFFIPDQILGLKIVNPTALFDFKMVNVLTVLTIAQLIALFATYHKEKLFAVIKNTRPLRFILNATALGLGVYLGTRIVGTPFENNIETWLMILNAFLVPFLIWLYSVGINDLNDQTIDKVAHPNRPLITKIISPTEVTAINTILLLIANGIAFNLGLRFFTISLLLSGLTYIYSAPPFRLKRVPFIASLTIALSIIATMGFGFMLMSQNQSLTNFPQKVIITTLILFTLIVNIKDIKDYEGDKKGNIKTLPVLLGKKRGKLAIAILNIVSFILFAALLSSNPALLAIALGFGIVAYLLTYNPKTNESALFTLYALFFIVVLIFAY